MHQTTVYYTLRGVERFFVASSATNDQCATAAVRGTLPTIWFQIMPQYRRRWTPGSTWFFTVNCAQRQENTLLIDNIHLLRSAFAQVKNNYPFQIDAIVVLPEHIHALWTLPEGDSQYSRRWRLIKMIFSKSLPITEEIPSNRSNRRERGIWQRRFWEHEIRDQADFDRHVEYIHWNPVKHGLVAHPNHWPHSSVHRYR